MGIKAKKKIKILRIIARLNIGGPAIHTILLADGLDESRFETILVSGRPEKDEGDMFYLAEEKKAQPVIIPELGRSLNLSNDIVAFWKLFCLIKREKPDIIHTHTAKAGALGRLAGLLYKFGSKLKAQSSKVKLIHTFHGHIFHSYFGRIKSTLFVWIERLLAVFTTKIIALSENLRKELIALKIARPKKIITVALGLELEQYLKIERNGLQFRDYQAIGIIGRLVPVKNHKMFLDVVRGLKNTLTLDRKLKFLIIGDGPLRQELEDYAEKLNIEQEVTFTGWIKDLEKIYASLDIVALTSLNEGTPVALIEAQAAACPCVATDVGGVTDVLEDGRSGFLVSAYDTQKLMESLIKLLNNPTLMQTMGKYGRDKVKDRFSKNRLVKDIETLYAQELSE